MHLIVTIILEGGLLKVNLIQYNFRYRNKDFFHYFSENHEQNINFQEPLYVQFNNIFQPKEPFLDGVDPYKKICKRTVDMKFPPFLGFPKPMS